MSWGAADVAAWLGVTEDKLDADKLARVIDSVTEWADKRYDIVTALEVGHEQALIMASANLWRLQYGSGGASGSGDRAPVSTAFDAAVLDGLADRLLTAGMFGPSANVVTEDA